MPDTKRCGHCRETKPLTDFYRLRGGAPHCWCKRCVCEATNARKRANKPKVLADAKAYRERNKEAVAQSKRRCRQNKLEQYKERTRKNREANPARACETTRRWKAENKERVQLLNARRRAQKHGNGPVDDIDRREVHTRDRGCCWLCEQPVPYARMHLDHVIPLSKGGTHTYGNVKTACQTCNLRKGARMPAEVAGG